MLKDKLRTVTQSDKTGNQYCLNDQGQLVSVNAVITVDSKTVHIDYDSMTWSQCVIEDKRWVCYHDADMDEEEQAIHNTLTELEQND